MARQEATYDNHLFNTWLEYRKERDNKSRAEIIREINSLLGTSYLNTNIVDFLKFNKSTPDAILQIIDQDLPDLLKWLFKKKGFDKKVNFKEVAEYLRSSTKKIKK